MSVAPPEGSRVLRYRSTHRKSIEGPPVLALVNSGSVPALKGQMLQQLFLGVGNDGPTTTGVRVHLGGDALTHGLIVPVELHVITILQLGGGSVGDRKIHPLDRDEQGWFADLPELELKSRVDQRQLPSGAGMLKALKDYHRSAVYFQVSAQAARAGSAP